MRSSSINLLLSVFIFLFPVSLLAQQFVLEDEEKIYDIEIIIFKNDRVNKGAEFLLPTPSPQRTSLTLDLSDPEHRQKAALNNISFLAPEELRLNDEVSKIIRSSRYSLLLHTAWRLPGVERGKGIPLWIKGGRTYSKEFSSIDERRLKAKTPLIEDAESENVQNVEPEIAIPVQTRIAPIDNSQMASIEALTEMAEDDQYNDLYELEGTITITLARYLHAEVDLVFRKPGQKLVESFLFDNNPSAPNLQTGRVSTELVSTTTLHNYSLKEHRRMRSKKLHYIDHPEYGMLVLITPYEAPKTPEIVVPVLTGKETQSAPAKPKTSKTAPAKKATTL